MYNVDKYYNKFSNSLEVSFAKKASELLLKWIQERERDYEEIFGFNFRRSKTGV